MENEDQLTAGVKLESSGCRVADTVLGAVTQAVDCRSGNLNPMTIVVTRVRRALWDLNRRRWGSSASTLVLSRPHRAAAWVLPVCQLLDVAQRALGRGGVDVLTARHGLVEGCACQLEAAAPPIVIVLKRRGPRGGDALLLAVADAVDLAVPTPAC